MAGVYGEIDSRADFDRILHDAIARSKRYVAQTPRWDPIEVIDTQLDAVLRWTSAGRQPTEQERESIDMSLIASRELLPTDDADMQRFVDELTWLHNYFEDWPTDDAAASATDDDFWDGDED